MNKSYLETIKSIDGKVFNIEYHQKRYESVLKSIGSFNIKNLQDYIKPPKLGLYRCRVEYCADNIKVSYHPYVKKEIYSLKLVFDNKINYDKKYSCRDELNSLYRKRDGCDEILIIKDLLVSDTSIANIAFYDGSLWITPKTPLLKGTTRARLLEEGKIIEKNIGVHEIRKFHKVALMNAMVDFYILDRYEILI